MGNAALLNTAVLRVLIEKLYCHCIYALKYVPNFNCKTLFTVLCVGYTV